MVAANNRYNEDITKRKYMGFAGSMVIISRHWTTYIFYAFLAVLVWVPLPLSSGPAWAKAFFNLLVAGLSLATLTGAWRAAHPLPEVFRLARWPIALWMLYCGWLLWQGYAGYSINVFKSNQQLLLTLSYLQLFVLTLFLVDSRDRVRQLFFTLVACGVFQALYGGLMTLSGVEKIWWIDKTAHRGVATGTFFNRNQLANYLVICLSAGCGLLIAVQQSGAINSWRELFRRLVEWLLSGSGWLRILLAVMVIGVVLTHSRMGNVSLFVSLTFVGLIWLWRNRSSRKRAFVLIGSMLIIDVLIVGSWFGIDKVVERIQSTQADNASEWMDEQLGFGSQAESEQDKPVAGQESVNRESVNQESVNQDSVDQESSGIQLSEKLVAPKRTYKKNRTDVNEWRDEAFPQLVVMAKVYAVTGIGLGNFSTGFFEYNRLKIVQYYNEAHCDYLQFIIEVGMPGFVLLALIVLFCAGCGLTTLWSSQSRLLQGVGFAVSMTTVASLLHAWVDFNFQSVAPSVLFVVMMALGVASRGFPDKPAIRDRVLKS